MCMVKKKLQGRLQFSAYIGALTIPEHMRRQVSLVSAKRNTKLCSNMARDGREGAACLQARCTHSALS